MWEVGTKDWDPFGIAGLRTVSADVRRVMLRKDEVQSTGEPDEGRKEFWHHLFQVWIVDHYENE